MENLRKKTNEEMIYDGSIVLILFLTFINFKNYGSVVFPVGAVGVLFYLLLRKRITITIDIVFLIIVVLMFSGTYEMIKNQYVLRSTFELLHHIFTPCIAVLFGYYALVTDFSGEKNIKRFCNFLLVVIVSLFIYGIINLGVEIASGKKLLANVNARKVYDIWLKLGLAATIQNAKFFLTIAFVPLIMFGKFKNIYPKVLMSIIVSISLYSAMLMGSRTFLIGFVMVTILSWVLNNVIGIKINNKRLGTSLALLICVLFILYVTNAFGFQDKITSSFLFQRLLGGASTSILEDPRLNMWGSVLRNLFVYPMGGYLPVGELKYAHNLWLDIAYGTGIIPFILFLTITGYFLYGYFLLIRTKLTRNIKIFLVAFLLTLLILYFMEPIIEGYYTHYLIFYIILGGICWDFITFMKRRKISKSKLMNKKPIS